MSTDISLSILLEYLMKLYCQRHKQNCTLLDHWTVVIHITSIYNQAVLPVSFSEPQEQQLDCKALWLACAGYGI